MNYTIAIRAWDEGDHRQDGPELVATIDGSDENPGVVDVHYRRGSYDLWRHVNLRAIAAFIVPRAAQADEAATREHMTAWVDGRESHLGEDEEEPAPPVVEVRSDRPAADWLTTAIRNDIRSGVYPPGSTLPIRSELYRIYPGATQYQARYAVKALQAEGLLAPGERAAGVRVLGPPKAQKASTRGEHPGDEAVLDAWRQAGSFAGAAALLGVTFAVARRWIGAARRREAMLGRPVIGPSR
jgi:hypothetical protein